MKKTSFKIVKMLLGITFCLLFAGQIVKADFVFGEPTPLPAPVNTPYFTYGVSMSADGLELYYANLGAISVAIRTSTADDWSHATHLQLGPEVNPILGQRDPVISADGLELYFSRGMATDIFRAQRQSLDDPWETAEKLDAPISSSGWDSVQSLSADGLVMYFNNDSITRRATRATKDSNWVLSEVSEPIQREAAISPSGLQRVFVSKNLPGGAGHYDLGMVTRPSITADWGDPVTLDALTNSSSDDRSPWIAYDGSVIFFSSDRPGGLGMFDVWQASISAVVDLNGDGRVDAEDVGVMAKYWGRYHPSCDIGPTPFGDGIVDEQDLLVLADYFVVEDDRLLARWKLDGDNCGAAYDSAGMHDGVIHGDPAWERDDDMLSDVLRLDGLDDYIDTPFVLDPKAGPFSVFLWINGGAPGQAIVSQQGGFGEWLSIDPTGRLMTGLSFPTPPLTADMVVTDGLWHHIGLVSDGAGKYLYVDGIEVAKDSTPPILPAAGGLYIGAGKGLEPGSFFVGLIDEVRIYNQALEPDEITELAY